MTRRVMVLVAVALALTAAPARALHAQYANPIARWKAIGHEGGQAAPNYLWDLAYIAASGAGYGACRLVTIRPTPCASIVAAVPTVLHLRGWVMGDYGPSIDWIYDSTTRALPAVTLALCETKGRKVCVLAVAGTVAVNLATARYASP